MSRESPSPEKFALALASRLNAVVPPNVSVRAQNAVVDVYGERGSFGGSGAAPIINDEDDRSLEERLEIVARTILNGAQDSIMEILREQWPVGPDGKAAYSGARVVRGQLRMWFGEEGSPLLELAPLPIAEIYEGGGAST
jgi:hypothetical protein